jgi:hypothetical protein
MADISFSGCLDKSTAADHSSQKNEFQSEKMVCKKSKDSSRDESQVFASNGLKVVMLYDTASVCHLLHEGVVRADERSAADGATENSYGKANVMALK